MNIYSAISYIKPEERKKNSAKAAFDKWCNSHSKESALSLAYYIREYGRLFDTFNAGEMVAFWKNVFGKKDFSKVKDYLKRYERGLYNDMKAKYEMNSIEGVRRAFDNLKQKQPLTSAAVTQVYVDPNFVNVTLDNITESQRAFVKKYSLSEMIDAATDSRNLHNQGLKHLVALAFAIRFKGDSRAANAILSNPYALLKNIHPNTRLLYVRCNNNKITRALGYNNEEMINNFPYGADLTKEGHYKNWLINLNPDYLLEDQEVNFPDNYFGTYLLAARMSLETPEGFINRADIWQGDIVAEITLAHERAHLLTLAQYIENYDNKRFNGLKEIERLIKKIKEEMPWLKSLADSHYFFANLHAFAQKKDKSEDEKTTIRAARFAIFGAYGDPREERNNDMVRLLRFNSLEEYDQFRKEFFTHRVNQINQEMHDNPLIREWLETQRRVREKKEGN